MEPRRGDRQRVAPPGLRAFGGAGVPGVALRSTPGYRRSPLRGFGDGYLIRTLNVIVPDSPGMTFPSIAQRRTSEPAAFGVATNVAGRDDWADPLTYSSRVVRLSATTTSVISSVVGFENRRRTVTSWPIRSGWAGSIVFWIISDVQPGKAVISSGPRAWATTAAPWMLDSPLGRPDHSARAAGPVRLWIPLARRCPVSPRACSRPITSSGRVRNPIRLGAFAWTSTSGD